MSMKSKEFLNTAFKEGSFTILSFMASSLVILANFPNEFVLNVMLYCYLIGFVLSFSIISYKIILNQYVMFRLRMNKLKFDMLNNDHSDLKNDNTIQGDLVPIATDLIKEASEKISELKEKSKEEI